MTRLSSTSGFRHFHCRQFGFYPEESEASWWPSVAVQLSVHDKGIPIEATTHQEEEGCSLLTISAPNNQTAEFLFCRFSWETVRQVPTCIKTEQVLHRSCWHCSLPEMSGRILMGILRDKGFLVEISDVLEMIFFFLNPSRNGEKHCNQRLKNKVSALD